MVELIDVHCHLDDEAFNKDLDLVIENARKTGVIKIITSCIYEKSIQRTEEITEKYKGFVFSTMGLDYSVLDEERIQNVMDSIRKNKDKIVGIGEVGLDFFIFRNASLQEKNKAVFKKWIDFAMEVDLPLVVHSRSAGKYAIEILIRSGIEKVLMHAFDGSVGYAIQGAKHGFYFSIPPSIVRSEQKQKLAKHLSLENLMLESDSPVLGPERGIRNTPSNVIISAGMISKLKKIPIEEVCKKTTFNANKLFFEKYFKNML